MGDIRPAMLEALKTHSFYVDSQTRAWCLGCLDPATKRLLRFANVDEFNAHLVDLLLARFEVTPIAEVQP
ncbi:hypothetical protein [Nocardia aurea]|uniref:hypothetical protein n=1 Tax=Nocardia aurea TaxID=2144174 RepID=UPI0033B2532A